jgi:hypothetical protein
MRQPSSREVVIYSAAALIYAALHLIFAVLPSNTLPLRPGLTLTLQPGVVVPIFMGLTAGPVAGLWVGLAGRLLGDVLAGKGFDGFGLLYSGLLGLIAGLGFGRLAGFRTLRDLVSAVAWITLACIGASLVTTLLAQTLIAGAVQGHLALATGIDQTLSGVVSGEVNVLLLIPTALYVWGRGRRSEVGGQRSEGPKADKRLEARRRRSR